MGMQRLEADAGRLCYSSGFFQGRSMREDTQRAEQENQRMAWCISYLLTLTGSEITGCG